MKTSKRSKCTVYKDSKVKSIKIENNIPIKGSRPMKITNRTKIVIEAIKSIQVGESFLFPFDGIADRKGIIIERAMASSESKVFFLIAKYGKGKKFTTRRQYRDIHLTGYRIWRTK